MRLVIRYHVTDGCTYDYQVIQPIEYESEEALIEAFNEHLKKSLTINSEGNYWYHQFQIGGHQFSAHNFRTYQYGKDKKGRETCEISEATYQLPDIYSLDEWFQLYAKPRSN